MKCWVWYLVNFSDHFMILWVKLRCLFQELPQLSPNILVLLTLCKFFVIFWAYPSHSFWVSIFFYLIIFSISLLIQSEFDLFSLKLMSSERKISFFMTKLAKILTIMNLMQALSESHEFSYKKIEECHY